MNKKIKQISFLSSIVILVSGTIGSGIFFKNSDLFKLGQGNANLVLSLWLLTGFGIIAFGIGIAEMSSKVKGNRGVLEWTKHFLPKRLHFASKNYIQLFFIPLVTFALPLYAVKGMQNALVFDGIYLSGWSACLIAFCFFIWFAIITYISTKIGEAVQWITLIIKFIPLFVLPIFSLLMKSTGTSYNYWHTAAHAPVGFSSLGNGGMILIAGIPAIMFSIDGFYTVTTLRDKMKQPKKMPLVIIIGLVIITLIYIWVSLSFMNGSKTGKYGDIQWLQNHPKVSEMFSWFIFAGILGVVNGYVQFATNTYINLHKKNESWLTKWFEIKIFRRKTKQELSGLLSLIIFVTCFYIFFSIMGIYGWNTKLDYKGEIQSYSNILGFDDVITNFKSLLMFVTIAMSLVFALKTFDKKTWRGKSIYIFTIIGITFILITLLYQYISNGVNMTGFRSADKLSSIISFSLLVCIPILCYLFALIEDKMQQKIKNK